MNALLNRISGRVLAILVVLVLLGAAFLTFTGGSSSRTLTAHFSRAVSVYKGSEMRVMGVKIGTVTAVIPEGDSVRVVMSYDSEYKLPADAKAAIVTPTLVADRFVQIAPAYTGGKVMADKGDINMADTGTPVELDRIYNSLDQLTQALGPTGANKDGSLNTLLTAGAAALKGNGQAGNETLINLSQAVQTFGDNRGPLFDSVTNLSQLTQTLGANDKLVSGFITDLAAVSAQLSGDRQDLAGALDALARAVGIVKRFVRDNRASLNTDVRQLTDILGVMAKERESLNTIAHLGGLGLGNLAEAYDAKTASIGSRIQFGPNGNNLGNILCDTVTNAKIADAKFACEFLKTLVQPLAGSFPDLGAGFTPPQLKLGGVKPPASLDQLLGALKAGGSR